VISYPCFYICRSIWIKFSAEDVNQKLLSNCELCGNRLNESRSLRRSLNEYLPAKRPIRVKFGVINLHVSC
jgi:transcription initiation factor IIE alpha subunit